MPTPLASFTEGFANSYTERKRREERRARDEAWRNSTREMEDWTRAPSAPGIVGYGDDVPAVDTSRDTVGHGPVLEYDGAISNRVGHAYNRFRKAGLPHHVAAGLTGNLMQESGAEINPAAVGDNGNAFGAGQWNGPRRHAYLNYAKSRGSDPTDFDTQLDFLLHEGQTSEKSAWDAIMATSTPTEAARVASERFWRPGLPHVENRQSYAKAVANRYAQAAPQPETQPAPEPVGLPPEESTWKWFKQRSA